MKKKLIAIIIIFIIITSIIVGIVYLKSESKTEPTSKQKQELNLSSEQESELEEIPEVGREPIPEPTPKQSEQDIEKMKDKANNLKRDIIIDSVSKSEIMETTGGYSESYDIISLEDKKLYHIYYHGFLGEEPDAYKVLEKDLTQEQIEQLKKLENMESEEITIT